MLFALSHYSALHSSFPIIMFFACSARHTVVAASSSEVGLQKIRLGATQSNNKYFSFH